MKNKIWTIVVNYQAEKTLARCLASLKSKQVIVIDNNQRNIGFAKAVNQGMREAIKNGAEAVFLLNPDARVVRGKIEDLFNIKAEIVAPVIEDRWGEDWGGVVNWRWGRAEHTKVSRFKGLRVTKRNFVSGCAMLIKKEVWEKIGFFDERFFLYYEDVDYCVRARRAGFRVAVTPRVRVFHALKRPEDRAFQQNWHLITSHWLFLRKYHFGVRAYFYWLALAVRILL